jgi:hypothetical protein
MWIKIKNIWIRKTNRLNEKSFQLKINLARINNEWNESYIWGDWIIANW